MLAMAAMVLLPPVGPESLDEPDVEGFDEPLFPHDHIAWVVDAVRQGVLRGKRQQAVPRECCPCMRRSQMAQ